MARLQKIAVIFGALAMLSCAGCSPAAILNLTVPRAGYTVHRDIAYGADPRQKMDIYMPDRLAAPAPVILFFYGGAWQTGNKAMYAAFGQAFASRGIVVAIADYRVYPQVKYPVFLQDGASALRVLHDGVKAYGGNPGRIFLAGHSAGAYIAVMLASDLRYIREENVRPDWIRGVIGIAGPYDFLPLTDPAIIALFGGANRPETQPINHIDGKRPPMLLVAGSDDTTVSPANTVHMAAKLRQFGGTADEIFYPGVGHIGIILSLAPLFRYRTHLRDDVVNFVAGH